ncbi:MAG: hypothetical protein ABIQ32_06230 [Sphingomicrobium sp.]
MRWGVTWWAALAALLAPVSARAADGDLLSPNVLAISGDLRLVAADGEASWLHEEFGKLRGSGSRDASFRVKPELGSVDLVWQPQVGFAWSATVVGTLQGGERTEAGLSEAFISYKPMRRQKLRFSARAGLMWPAISLEHGGADWHVLDTVTPSAINSWVGEEVRPLAIEGTLGTQAGAHDLSATIGVFAANDTAGTLLTLRGWALHDRKTLAFHRQRLPPLPELLEYSQPQFTTPLLDVAPGFAKHPGYYAKIAWQLPVPVRVEVFHYDNRADPEAVNEDVEWGWRTRFDNVGLVARVGPAIEIKAQAMKGSTLMGFASPDRLWIDTKFSSAFLLATHTIGKSRVAARVELFRTRNRGSLVTTEEDEAGWATTAAYRRDISDNFTLLAELLHVHSKRAQRTLEGFAPAQDQTQLQLVARARW